VRDDAEVAALFERVGDLDHVVFTAGDAFTPRPLADLGLSDARAGWTIGEPEDIALAHLYLMQNPSVTGTVLTVDGGLVLAGG
jgi:hypothetical protein